MLIGLSCEEVDAMFIVLEDRGLSFGLLSEGGTRGDRRDGVNVGALLIRAGVDLRWPFLGGIVK